MRDWIVECSEPGGGSLPERFGRPGQMRRVGEILDRWEGEDHRYFRVRADDGGVYILRHDLRRNAWRIHFFRA